PPASAQEPPRSQRSPGGSAVVQMNPNSERSVQPVPSSPRPLPAPHSVRQPMRSSGNEGPQSARNLPVSSKAAVSSAEAAKQAPSTLTLIAVAVGFLLVGVVLAVVVLK